MNEPIHVDLTPAETDRIVGCVEYIAAHLNDKSVRAIKQDCHLTDTEYETVMEIAMPLVRMSGKIRMWKYAYCRGVRHLMRALTPPSKLPPRKRRKMDWSEDPVVRLEKLERMITAAYNEMYRSDKTLEEIMQERMLGVSVDEEEDDDE